MKIRKIFTKTLFFFPFYLIVVLLYNVVFYQTDFDLELLVIPFLLSVFTIYINVLDYDKFNDIAPEDYLESSHTSSVKFSEDAWKICKNFDAHLVSHSSVATEYSKNVVEYTIKFNILIGQLNSILKFKRHEDNIEIKINKQYISVLPDRGVNLKIIRQVENKLKFYANTESD
jgi:hypothetical protein